MRGLSEPVAGSVADTVAVTTSASLVPARTYAGGNTIPAGGTDTAPAPSIVPVMLTATLAWKPGAVSLSSWATVAPAGPPHVLQAPSAASVTPSTSLSTPSLHWGKGRGVRSNAWDPMAMVPVEGTRENGPGLATFCA